MRQLGRTGLHVSPLGIGGGSGIEADDLLYAFERGINYFFYSSDLHHFLYGRSAPALRQLCAQGSVVRDQVVLATVSYVDDPDKLVGVLLDQFGELGIDYIDVFHWGWITNRHDLASLIESAQGLKEDGENARHFRQLQAIQQQAQEVNKELLKRGLVRYIGMSFHSRQAALKAMPDIDVMMIRYNIMLTDVEQIVFSQLSTDKTQNPGVVAFNTAHSGLVDFLIPPPHYPKGLYVPSVPDCYRFALSNPWVDLVLTGVANRQEIDQALAAMEQGPVEGDDYEFLREYGSLFAPSASVAGVPR
jgi:predicted aldo/keto reductase-like oxidoreductase